MTVTEFIKLAQTTMTQKERDECRMVWRGLSKRVYDIEPVITSASNGQVLLVNP